MSENKFKAVLTKPEAYTENPELLEIFERTMWPYLAGFMAEMPDTMTGHEKFEEALRLFFGVDSRTIDTYIVMEDFKIQSPFQNPDEITWDSRTEDLRVAKTGDVILARLDQRTPWEINVQVMSNMLTDQDDRKQFAFSATDFYAIRSRLRYVSSH